MKAEFEVNIAEEEIKEAGIFTVICPYCRHEQDIEAEYYNAHDPHHANCINCEKEMEL